MTERINYLMGLIPEDLDYDTKYRSEFNKFARYMGNGVYQWNGIYSSDTAELFLMGVLSREGIEYEYE